MTDHQAFYLRYGEKKNILEKACQEKREIDMFMGRLNENRDEDVKDTNEKVYLMKLCL